MSLFPPEVLNVPFAIRLDQDDANTLYIGKADPGSVETDAVWQVRRLTVSGAVTSVLWADGDDEFDNVWQDRASLNYS